MGPFNISLGGTSHSKPGRENPRRRESAQPMRTRPEPLDWLVVCISGQLALLQFLRSTDVQQDFALWPMLCFVPRMKVCP